MKLKIKITKEIYTDKKTLFRIFKAQIIEIIECNPIDKMKLMKEMTFKGVAPVIKKGDAHEIDAELILDQKTGKYINVTKFKNIKLEYEVELSGFLKRRIKGITKITSEAIVEKLGINAIDIIINDYKSLTEVKGITESKAKSIQKQLLEHKQFQELMDFLELHNIQVSLSRSIYASWKELSVQKLIENPYIIYSEDINIIDIEKLAKSLNLDFLDNNRIKTLIRYYIDMDIKKNGNIYTDIQDLYTEIQTISSKIGVYKNEDIPIDIIKIHLETLKEEGRIKLEQNRVYRKDYNYIENNIVRQLKRLKKESLKNTHTSKAIEEKIKEFELENDVELAIKQKESIIMAIQNRFSILTGGPGTGKTTTLKAIIEIYKKLEHNNNIELLAPTGKASKRMTETTNLQAKTIHRALSITPYNTGEHKKLETNFVIIDESSMIDAYLFNSLLESIDDNCKILLVGDVDQLPSVGAGLILRDLINSDIIEYTRLETIFRQAVESFIVRNSYRVINGDIHITRDNSREDFIVGNYKNVETYKKKIVDAYGYYLKKGYKKEDITILSPMTKGELGIIEINKLIQQNYNNDDTFKYQIDDMNYYKVNDRVMQTKNNYDIEVYNGEVGTIVEVSLESIIVKYPESIVEYDRETIKELILAYATTIHKSQGSEYKVVINVIGPEHTNMINRNLIYTAWTRAKETLVVLTNIEILNIGIQKNNSIYRNSHIIEKLKR